MPSFANMIAQAAGRFPGGAFVAKPPAADASSAPPVAARAVPLQPAGRQLGSAMQREAAGALRGSAARGGAARVQRQIRRPAPAPAQATGPIGKVMPGAGPINPNATINQGAMNNLAAYSGRGGFNVRG